MYVLLRTTYLLVVATLLLLLNACESNAKASPEQSVEQRQTQEIQELKAKLAALESKPKHHYELRPDGLRTFRFDSETGETCIQLTTTADWKRPETKRQGCEYQDMVNAPDADNRTYLRAECLIMGDKSSCNELWGKAK